MPFLTENRLRLIRRSLSARVVRRALVSFLVLVAALACIAAKPFQSLPKRIISVEGLDYWVGGLIAALSIVDLVTLVWRLYRRWTIPEVATGLDILPVILAPDTTATRLINKIREIEPRWGEFDWRFASRHELPMFARWSDADPNIGRRKADRLVLYQEWFDAEPRSFALLTHYGVPIGGTIIVPLNSSGVSLLGQDDTSAMNLRRINISNDFKDVLIDTVVSSNTYRKSYYYGFHFIALIKEHASTFLERGLQMGNIWLEPDHPVFIALAHSSVAKFRGSVPNGDGTWSIDLSDPRLSPASQWASFPLLRSGV